MGHDGLGELPGMSFVPAVFRGLEQPNQPRLLEHLGGIVGQTSQALALLGVSAQVVADGLDPIQHLVGHSATTAKNNKKFPRFSDMGRC